MSMEFVTRDTLSELLSYSNIKKTAIQAKLTKHPQSYDMQHARKDLQKVNTSLVRKAEPEGAVKMIVVLGTCARTTEKSVGKVEASYDSMLLKGKTDFIKSLEGACKYLSLNPAFALNLLGKLDVVKHQKQIKAFAAKYKLDKAGLVTKNQLHSKGTDITHKDFLKIATKYELYPLFKSSVSSLSEDEMVEILDAASVIGLPEKWCEEILDKLDPNRDQLLIKIMLKELGETSLVNAEQLESHNVDISPNKLMMVAAKYGLVNLLKHAMQSCEDKEEESEIDESDAMMLSIVEIAQAHKSTNVVKALLQMILLDDDMDGFELFDACVKALPSPHQIINDKMQNILQLIVEQGNLPLLKHYVTEYLQEDSYQKHSIWNQDKDHMCALHYAASLKDGVFMRELLKFDGNNYALSIKSTQGTPLSIAIMTGEYTKDGPLYAMLESNESSLISESQLLALRDMLSDVTVAKGSDVMSKLEDVLDSGEGEVFDVEPPPLKPITTEAEIDAILAQLELAEGGRHNSLISDAGSEVSVVSDDSFVSCGDASDSGCEAYTPKMERKTSYVKKKSGLKRSEGSSKLYKIPADLDLDEAIDLSPVGEVPVWVHNILGDGSIQESEWV